jgi:hypothetical protein
MNTNPSNSPPAFSVPPCLRGYFFLFLLFLLPACAEQHSTRMTVRDFQDMATEMAQSLSRSPAIAGRGPDSPPMVISITKVENLSSDVMSEGEQWGVIAKLRGELPIQALRQQKNIAFIIPAEQTRRLRERGDLGTAAGDFGSERRPTHTMAATFRSVTRAYDKGRTELYFCEFSILDLAGGEPVWTDKFEYKRAASGHIWD